MATQRKNYLFLRDRIYILSTFAIWPLSMKTWYFDLHPWFYRKPPNFSLCHISYFRYDEGCKYNFNRPQSDRYNYRHFTQMTWQGTRRLGVGISYGKVKNLQCLYFVARYSPRGNNGDTFTYSDNVKKGVFDPSFCKPVPNQPASQEVVLKRMIN